MTNAKMRSLESYHDKMTTSQWKALFLAVECGENVLIAGGTSSGKSTFANALAASVNPNWYGIGVHDEVFDGLSAVTFLRNNFENTGAPGIAIVLSDSCENAIKRFSQCLEQAGFSKPSQKKRGRVFGCCIVMTGHRVAEMALIDDTGLIIIP